jgi:acetoacetate decarboxylase
MPNLKTWIEAQLKKGYSKRQIKDSLIHRGYSSSSVASVDNIVSEHNVLGKSKSIPKLTIWVAIFLVVLVLAIIIFVSLSEKVDEVPVELQGKAVISGILIGINDNTFTVLSKGGEVINITHETPEKDYIINKKLSDGKVVKAGKEDLLPGSKVVITTFIENGKTALYSIVLQNEVVDGRGFRLIGGKLISVEDNTFKLLTPHGKVIEVTHQGAKDNFSIMKQLPDKSTIEVGKEKLVWGTNVVLVTVIDNGQTFIRSVVIQEKNVTSPIIRKIVGKLIGIKGNTFDILNKNGKHVVRNSAPFNNITLKKRLLNGTVVNAERTELKPGVNVVISTLNTYGKTLVRSIVILEVQESRKDFNTFNGKLVKISDNSITIAKEKKLTTLLHNGPINEVPVLKRLSDGSTEEVGWQELKIGSNIMAVTTMENGESVVRSILVLPEAK